MRKLVAFIILGFFFFKAFSQREIVVPVKGIDTLASTKIKPLALKKAYPFAIFTASDSLLFKLDSLIRPFYTFQPDSSPIKTNYIPKYRVYFDAFKGDTTYIPLPKQQNLIAYTTKLKIDTIQITNPIKPAVLDTLKMAAAPVWWANKNSIGFDITQAAFVNWNAGGENSISGLLQLNFERTYKKLQTLWRNEIFIRYGLNKQRDRELRKTDDKIEFNSTFGYRKDTISNWYYSVKFNLRTQFTDGFSYPDVETPISRFFAPGYLFLGIGSQYNSKKNKFTLYLSPITLKSTFVFDDRLSNEGAFGVNPGKNARHEFGTFIELKWDEPLFKNVLMSNRVNFYSDYINKFGNIDTNWQLSFNLKVNKFLQANLGTHLIYDDDIKFKEDTNNDGILEITGARAQFKQVLAIGLLYKF